MNLYDGSTEEEEEKGEEKEEEKEETHMARRRKTNMIRILIQIQIPTPVWPVLASVPQSLKKKMMK